VSVPAICALVPRPNASQPSDEPLTSNVASARTQSTRIETADRLAGEHHLLLVLKVVDQSARTARNRRVVEEEVDRERGARRLLRVLGGEQRAGGVVARHVDKVLLAKAEQLVVDAASVKLALERHLEQAADAAALGVGERVLDHVLDGADVAVAHLRLAGGVDVDLVGVGAEHLRGIVEAEREPAVCLAAHGELDLFGGAIEERVDDDGGVGERHTDAVGKGAGGIGDARIVVDRRRDGRAGRVAGGRGHREVKVGHLETLGVLGALEAS
jgi:hypothetical protein